MIYLLIYGRAQAYEALFFLSMIEKEWTFRIGKFEAVGCKRHWCFFRWIISLYGKPTKLYKDNSRKNCHSSFGFWFCFVANSKMAANSPCNFILFCNCNNNFSNRFLEKRFLTVFHNIRLEKTAWKSRVIVKGCGNSTYLVPASQARRSLSKIDVFVLAFLFYLP